MHRKPPEGNARRVHHSGSNMIFTLTNKRSRITQCESYAEYKLALCLDRDPAVADYRSQPEQLTWTDDSGKGHIYVPDFMVWFLNGDIAMYEVTVKRRLATRPALQARAAAGAAICHERGWTFRQFMEDTLPNDTELANLTALLAFRPRSHYQPPVVAAIHQQLQAHTRLSVAALMNQLAQQHLSRSQVQPVLGHLIWHGQVHTDLSQLLIDDLTFLPHIVLQRGRS